MKLPPFTLVHRASAPGRDPSELERKWLDLIDAEARPLGVSLREVRPRQLRRTILTSVGAEAIAPTEVTTDSLAHLGTLVKDLRRRDRVVTVGIWDIGARVGRLPSVIERMNVVQSAFTFFEVQAAIPAGLVSQPERVASWARELLGRSLRRAEREEIELNIIAEDFFSRAEPVRRDLGVDYLVGVTPSMVAGERDSEIYWNHFSTFERRIMIASTRDMRRFAREAHRSIEIAVALLVLAELLVTIHYPRLGFHEDRGCLFDSNIERSTIVESLREARIEPDCLRSVRPRYREAVQSILHALRNYQRPG